MRQRLSSFLLLLPVLSWVLLLLSTLSQGGESVGSSWPAWSSPVALAAFVLGVFIYYRYQPSPLEGQDFVGLLRRLFAGPGMLALACIGLHLAERLMGAAYLPESSQLFKIVYTINVGLFMVFLARINHAWRALVLFRASGRLQTQWLIFEVLLGVLLLLRLLAAPVAPNVGLMLAVGLALYGLYLSGNQKWVAYLTIGSKWQAVALQAALLLGLLLCWQYFHLTAIDFNSSQHAFLQLAAAYGVFYALIGMLVALFNMPMANVIEQHRTGILSLQRLTQIIQRGQTPSEIYQMLLESAVETVRADAAWLDLEAGPMVAETPEATSLFRHLTPAQAEALREHMFRADLRDVDFLSNDLAAGTSFTGLDLPYHSLIMLPMQGVQHRYGALYLLKEQTQGFDHEDLSILQTFASQAVLSIENLQLVATSLQNQRTQEELKIASQVQDSLIPKDLPTDNWFEISSHSLAAKEVGGDFYDFLHLPGRRLAVLIGDVSGKGVTAAFHMAQMKGIFHALMQENPLAKNERDKFPVPSKFMAQANTALIHCLEKSSFITSTLYIIDYEQGGFMFARAGHCHTLYYHAMREEVFYFESTGLGLGIIRNESYEKHIKNQFYDYSPGDVMVIYTDGIVEARGHEASEYGEERLKQRLEESYYMEADEIKSFLLDDVNSFTHGYPIHDDQTLLVIKFKASQPMPSA